MQLQHITKGFFAAIALAVTQSLALADHPRILIDCGGTTGTAGNGTATVSPANYAPYSNVYWNNFNSVTAGAAVNNLVTTNNTPTTVGVSNTVAWGGVNGPANGGLWSGSGMNPSTALLGDFGISNATMDYFYAFSPATPAFKLTGLTGGNTYRLSFFGSRTTNTVSDTRFTTNTVAGGNGTFSVWQQTTGPRIGSNGTYSGNDSNIVSTPWLTPDSNNQISDTVSSGGTGASVACYMNILAITVNRAPVANADSFGRAAGDPLTLTTAQLLANDSDPDGDTLRFDGFGSLPAGATTNATSITLPGTNTTQTFTYTIDDGNGLTNTALVTVSVVVPGHRDFLIDFGPNDVSNGDSAPSPDYLGQYWNNMIGAASSSIAGGTGLANLITTNNVASSLGLTLSNGFSANGKLSGGLLTPSYALLGNLAVTNATEDYFFTTAQAGLTLTNLKAGTVYQLRLFGTRDQMGSTRVTRYTATGGNGSFSADLTTSGLTWTNNGTNYYGNNNTVANVSGITPDANNQIQLGVSVVAGGFAYLGLMEISEVNHAPTVTNASVTRVAGLAVKLLKTSLAADVDGDPLTFTLGPTTNGATLTQDDSYIYVPANTVSDQFTFTVSDGFGGTNSGTVTLLVGQVTPTIAAVPTASAISYGETLASSTLNGGAATDTLSGVAVPGSFAFTTPSLLPTAAGITNVSVTFTPADTANYSSITTTVAVTVNGVSPTLLAPPTASAISYGQTLADSLLSGGAVTNSTAGVPVPGTFGFTTPALLPGAGITNVSVTFVPADPGYSPITTTVAVTVGKTTPTLTPPSASGLIYGQSLASSTLSDGAATNAFNHSPVAGTFAFTAPATRPEAGVSSQGVTFTPADPANYNSAGAMVSMAVTVRTNLVAVFGSSVAKGVGSSSGALTNGSLLKGYAGLMTAALAGSGWTVTNASLPGDTTAGALGRFNTDLLPVFPNDVWIGYSLANEGLAGSTNPAGVVGTFSTNLNSLIALCRSNGFYPATVLCYPDNAYSASEYGYLKAMNQVINSWNVPSINLLGALDDGHGHWVSGYNYDSKHPNDAGHRELFYSFVPSLFDAIAAGKTNSPQLAAATTFARLAIDPDVMAPITFTPSDTFHSFTMSFRVRSTNSGTIAAIRTGSNYATLEIRADKLVYVSPSAQEIAFPANATNGGWHDVALAYRFALTNTALVVDGVLAGTLSEQYVPEQFTLGGPDGASDRAAAPAVADFQNLCLYRAAWNPNEAVAQMQGNLQQASLEICATLDDASFVSGSPAANRAQSLSFAVVNTARLAAMQSVTPPSSLTAQSVSGSSVKLAWTGNSTSGSGFVIERRLTGSSAWNDVALLPAGSTSYTDISLSSGVSYDYRVAALEGGLRGNYANIASITPGLGAHQSILVDFGPNDGSNGVVTLSPDYLGQYWNNVTNAGNAASVPAGVGLANLTTTSNSATAIGLVIPNTGFSANGILNGGLLAPSYSLLGNFAVTNATEDYFYTTNSALVVITNLDSTANYRLRLFGTRDTSIARTTRYLVVGGNGSFTNDLATSGTGVGSGGANGNNSTVATLAGVTPDSANQIQLSVSALTGGFGYLGIMELLANHSPVAQDFSLNATVGQTLCVPVIDGTNAPTDPDGDGLAVTAVSGPLFGGGLAATNGGAGFLYTASMAGTNQFTYTVSDPYGGTATGTVTVVVAKATPALSAPNVSPITYGQTLASSILSGGQALNALTGTSVSGDFAFSTPDLAPNAGVTNVLVIFTPADTANYNSASTAVSLLVNPAALSITANDDTKTYGQTRTYGAGSTAFSSSGLVNGEQVGSITLTASGGGAATDAVGTYTLTPSAAKDGSFNPANYNIAYHNGSLNVVPAGTLIVLSSSSNPSGYKEAIFINATLPPDATGSVIFSTASGPVSTNALNSGTTASPAIATLPRGTNIITAVYSGDVNYLGSTNLLSQIVTNHPPTVADTTYYRAKGLSLKIAIADLLTNATDLDGDTLTLQSVGNGAAGATILTDDTYVYYVPGTGANSNSNDGFNYTVGDGVGGSATANIFVSVYSAAGSAQMSPPTNGVVNITFYGIPNYTYLVQTTTNLSAPWSTLCTNVAGTNGSWLFIDSHATNPQQYYRLAQP